MDALVSAIKDGNVILIGLTASLVAGCATGVGALPLLVTRTISKRFLDASLGFAAGVMLAATSFSLIVPAIEFQTEELSAGTFQAAFVVVAGILLGGIFIDLLDKKIPHTHFIKGHEGDASRLKKIWLFVIAITLHNFPEGLAVGVGFGSGSEEHLRNGLSLAMGIGLQNIPEGMAVAFALYGEKYSVGKSIGVALLSGLVEPVGGLLGVSIVSAASTLLPWGLAFAAGAMLFVISDEIIPETHRGGFERLATFGVMVGFCVMMLLDVTLG